MNSVQRMVAGRAAAVGLVALALAGCNTTAQTVATPAPVPNDYRLRHPIALQEANRKIALFVGTNRGGLNAVQRADVLAFAHAWKRDSTGGIIVDVPIGTSNQRAAADAAREVESILIAASVPQHAFRLRPYQPGEAGKLAPIKLNYPRITAEAGPCGLWPQDIGLSSSSRHFENRPYWNLGCSTQRNLAAMVENPADLVQPRGETDAYTPRRTTVLDKYRRGEGTATTYPNANQGKISDVGQ